MKPIEKLEALVAKLRAPDGCPWDREQSHATLKTALIEECYELIEAIDADDDHALREELGDVLLQVVFHAQLAAEGRRFKLDDVANAVIYKLIARHPHIFEPYPELRDGPAPPPREIRTSAQVLDQWADLKAREKPERTSALDGIPAALPALMRAQKVQARAKTVGFDWPTVDGVLQKLDEEIRELREAQAEASPEALQDELGDILFTVVNLARHVGCDAEETLRQATAKFETRFRAVEATVQARGQSLRALPLEALEQEWQAAKAALDPDPH